MDAKELLLRDKAADTIDMLFECALSDRAPSTEEMREALRTADKLRGESGYVLPEVGSTMYDGNCPVTIEKVTHYTAELYHLKDGDGPSIEEYHANDCDPDAPVVFVTYPNGDKLYAMPLDRLSHSR